MIYLDIYIHVFLKRFPWKKVALNFFVFHLLLDKDYLNATWNLLHWGRTFYNESKNLG